MGLQRLRPRDGVQNVCCVHDHEQNDEGVLEATVIDVFVCLRLSDARAPVKRNADGDVLEQMTCPGPDAVQPRKSCCRAAAGPRSRPGAAPGDRERPAAA